MSRYHSADLLQATRLYPAIDNHAHPLLSPANKNVLPLEGIISEASDGALIKDAPHTLACFRAASQLEQFFRMPINGSWDDVKEKRASMDYIELCRRCFDESSIQCILMDDGLAPKERLETIGWHDQFTKYEARRILRIETEAEAILQDLFTSQLGTDSLSDDTARALFVQFTSKFRDHLKQVVSESNGTVVGFKSIICYRTGLNVSLTDSDETITSTFNDVLSMYRRSHSVRLQHKPLNDYVLRLALEFCGDIGKPIQFHTGFGDNDITLTLASPALLQPLIKAYPQVKFVLLHASYPFTREAGYLTSVYSNVFLDFGLVFPLISGQGQHDILSQVFELSPTNKIMFSTDAHYWPESYYLGTIQGRKALYDVLVDAYGRGDVTEAQAIRIAKDVLFKNANKIYELWLPNP